MLSATLIPTLITAPAPGNAAESAPEAAPQAADFNALSIDSPQTKDVANDVTAPNAPPTSI